MSPNGYVIYRGSSRLDGAPVLAAISRQSHNSKIGQMAQAWILRADAAPTAAIADGSDRSICGDCVHRSGGRTGRSCYVIPWLGPLAVWRSIEAGRYLEASPAACSRALAGEQLRLAAYGDPAAIPTAVWRDLATHLRRVIGYSHQWATCDQRLRAWLMASVETEAEADRAHALGWRTFRARRPLDPVRPDEIVCPASDEAGHRVTCDACGLCGGLARAGARSIVIQLHGLRTAVLGGQDGGGDDAGRRAGSGRGPRGAGARARGQGAGVS